jgi:hypothetical protein
MRVTIGLFAIAVIILIRLTPFEVSPVLRHLTGAQLNHPAWAVLPPDAEIFADSQTQRPGHSGISGRIDLFTRMDLPSLRSFFTRALTDKGFAVAQEGIPPNLTPAAAEMLGIHGGLNAARTADGASLTVSFAGEEGLLRKARLLNVVWRTKDW